MHIINLHCINFSVLTLKYQYDNFLGDTIINAKCVYKESVKKDFATNEAEANAGMDRLKQMTNDNNPNEDQYQVFSKDCESVIKGDKKLMSRVHRHKEIPAIKDTPLAAGNSVQNQVARKRVKQLEKTPSNEQGKRSTGMDSECSIQGICWNIAQVLTGKT